MFLDPIKKKAVWDCPQPTTKKHICAFLRLAGSQALACPFTDLTMKGQPDKVQWSPVAERETLCLHDYENFLLNFTQQMDASVMEQGAVLSQTIKVAKRPVTYISWKLLSAETRYAEVEKEALIMKLRYYLLCQPFTLGTAHAPPPRDLKGKGH